MREQKFRFEPQTSTYLELLSADSWVWLLSTLLQNNTEDFHGTGIVKEVYREAFMCQNHTVRDNRPASNCDDNATDELDAQLHPITTTSTVQTPPADKLWTARHWWEEEEEEEEIYLQKTKVW
jgi:hypothetical protein